MAGRAADNEALIGMHPTQIENPQRSRGADDRLAPPHRGEMNRKCGSRGPTQPQCGHSGCNYFYGAYLKIRETDLPMSAEPEVDPAR
jgi:hypothetical protein